VALDEERLASLRVDRLAQQAASVPGLGPLDGPPVALGGLVVARAGAVAVAGVVGRGVSSLGPALAVALSRGAQQLEVIVTDDLASAAVLARRSEQFAFPVRVWSATGGLLEPGIAAPTPERVGPPVEALDLGTMIVEAGAEVIVEHGVVTAEVEGLEVARAVPDGSDWRLEVGVGSHDREASAVVHADVPTLDALRRAVDEVRTRRSAGQPHHPLNRLAAERWMRRWLIDHPSEVGAANLEPCEPALPRPSLRDPAPAMAVGRDSTDAPLLVACSVGIDLELVPEAADTRAASAPDAALVLVLPHRDAQPVTERLARALHRPARIVAIDDDRWRA
jgi:hypothetical protein